MAASRSPFEYLLNAPAGGGFAAAFQEGEAAASRQASEETSRASQRLNQQLAGLQIEDFTAGAPIRAAERERTLGQFRQLGNVPVLPGEIAPTPAMRLPESAQAFRTNLAPVWARLEQTNNLPAGFLDSLARVESTYGTTPDRGGAFVGPFQIGPTAAAEVGLPLEARADPTQSSEGAAKYAANVAQQLKRSLGRDPAPWEIYLGYQQGAGGARALLSNPQRPALEALTAAYSGDTRRARAALVQNGGTPEMTAGEFASLWQRKFTSSPVAQVSAEAAAPQTQSRAAPNLPAGALGEGFLVSPAGVPMTAPSGDLPAAGAIENQAVVSQPPPAAGLDDNRALRVLQAIGSGVGSLVGARFRGITGEGEPAAPAPGGVDLTRPSPAMLGGAAPTVAPTLGAGMAGGTQLPGALSPTPMAGQAQGLLPTAAQQARPVAPSAGAPAGQSAGLGLEYFGPAQRVLEQAAQQRAILQQRMNATQYLPYAEAQAERTRILAENNALLGQVRDANVDLAVGSLVAGQPQGVNALLQPYGLAIQPRVANGRLTGYDITRNGAVVNSNVAPEQVVRAVRENFSAGAAAAVAKQREAQAEVVLEGLKEALKAKATATAKIAEVEATARTRGFSQVQKRDDGSIVAIDPATGDGFIYRQVPVPGGKKGEVRDEIVKVRANVAVR